MKKSGQITYELTEQEFKQLKAAAFDLKYFFDSGKDKEDAERGIYIIQEILNDED